MITYIAKNAVVFMIWQLLTFAKIKPACVDMGDNLADDSLSPLSMVYGRGRVECQVLGMEGDLKSTLRW